MTGSGRSDGQTRPDSPTITVDTRKRRDVQQARRKAHRRPRSHPLLRRGAIVVASLTVVVLALGGAAYAKLSGNITKVDVSNQLGERPKNVAAADKVTNLKPMNILVMGVDTRNLGTTKYGTTPGARNDVTIIVHLAADRKSAVVVSVPRDSMTHAPSNCKDPKSSVLDGPITQWNENYGRGGPACVIRTVEGNTRIPIDHFMVVNFLGFKSMVEALGKVQVCLPKAIKEKKSHLNLPAGKSEITGDQALAFVRVRYNLGDGTDVGRIDRQQAFMSSMVQKVTSSNMLLRPDKLFGFLDAATHSLTTDPDLGSLNALREIAQSAAGLKPSQVRFVTVPIEPYPLDKNRRQWTSAADALWTSIREDTPLPGSKAPRSPKPTATSTPTVPPVLTVAPNKITVRVVNDSGISGLAKQASDDLRLQGFKLNASSTGSKPHEGVTVGYSSANEAQATTVAAAFPGAKLVPDESAGDVIRVNLGAGSPNAVLVSNQIGTTALPKHTLNASVAATASATPSSTVTIKARTADTDACTK